MELGNLAYVLIGLNIVGIIVTVTSFVNIKFNDLKHLAQDVGKIDTKVTRLEDEVKKNTIEVAKINERT